MKLEQDLVFCLAEEAIFDAEADGDLDAYLVTAICFIESAYEPNAMRYEPGYKYTINSAQLQEGARPHNCSRATEHNLQCCSFGMMQVMGATARELGFKGWLNLLLCPDEGLLCGVKYLHKHWRSYHSTRGLPAVISAYNQGTPRTDKSGAYKNQAYVERVMCKYNSLLNEAKGE